jgi:hypothetical protein
VRCRQKAPPSPPPDNYFELRLSVNTFCTLIWTLFGDECNYCKGMLDVAETLDLQEVHIICESFTANVCRRITWAILTDGRSFFNTVLVESQFHRAEYFKWPTSLINMITDDVQFAKAINRPMYPAKLCIATPAIHSMGGGGGGEGGYSGGNNHGSGQGNINRGTHDQKERNASGSGGGGRRQQQHCQPWVVDCHPRIVAMMADYVAARGHQI